MIPTYILIKSLGLMNSIWSLIIPGLISVFNLIVMKTFFEQLPRNWKNPREWMGREN
ncbi:hypothetical protein N6H14_26455 [Paenibacillus sp. CC-CFT747]|nr:hypothetical protein N6H14_26455 [Paenibacillus sp. CC-CFT747]